MISSSAKMYNAVLGLVQPRRRMLKLFTKPKRSRKKPFPKSLEKNFIVNQTEILNRPVITLQGKNDSSNKHIVFFHGGGYALEITPLHWQAIKQIVTRAQCKLTYIDYPLAPENSYKETFSMIEESYKQLTRISPEDEFIFLGDSAGGGLALAFLQKMRDIGVEKIPQKTILFSPWLDMLMDNDEIRKMEDTDMYLTIEALSAAAHSYAKGEDLSHPFLSPINGKMNDLGEIYVFVGSYELFLPDCRKLKTKCENTNTKLVLKEYPQMHHDWLIAGLPETKQAIGEICTFIEEN